MSRLLWYFHYSPLFLFFYNIHRKYIFYLLYFVLVSSYILSNDLRLFFQQFPTVHITNTTRIVSSVLLIPLKHLLPAQFHPPPYLLYLTNTPRIASPSITRYKHPSYYFISRYFSQILPFSRIVSSPSYASQTPLLALFYPLLYLTNTPSPFCFTFHYTSQITPSSRSPSPPHYISQMPPLELAHY